LEVSADLAKLHGADALAQAQAASLRRCEQPLQASAQVCGFADVRLGSGLVRAQHKHRRSGGQRRKELGVMLGSELETGQHSRQCNAKAVHALQIASQLPKEWIKIKSPH